MILAEKGGFCNYSAKYELAPQAPPDELDSDVDSDETDTLV